MCRITHLYLYWQQYRSTVQTVALDDPARHIPTSGLSSWPFSQRGQATAGVKVSGKYHNISFKLTCKVETLTRGFTAYVSASGWRFTARNCRQLTSLRALRCAPS